LYLSILIYYTCCDKDRRSPVHKPKLAHMEQKWYAVYTKPHWEKKVAELTNSRKLESYCPTNMVIRQWSDRKVKLYEPLFTSYVFVRINEKQINEVRQVPGIINFVYWLNKPAVIKDNEIDSIKMFLNEYKNIKLEKVPLQVNDKVRVMNGPLMDYVGDILEVNNKKVKVALPSLGYMMTAEVERTNVEIYNYQSLALQPKYANYALE
jgi:transcription antitermination factor NusG